MKLKKCSECGEYSINSRCSKCGGELKEAHYKFLRLKSIAEKKLE